jgi:hypothetical protein
MAKSSKISVMISSRCNDAFPDGPEARSLTEWRRKLKDEIEKIEIAGKGVFEVWINEDTAPQGGTWSSWETCMNAVQDCDILLAISNGNGGWANSDETMGICQAELLTGLSYAPDKVRLISIGNIPITQDRQGEINARFQKYVALQSLFSPPVRTGEQLLSLTLAALYDAIVRLAKAGVGSAATGRFSSGQALDWSRLDFLARQYQMVRVLREALLERDGSREDSGKVFVRIDGHDILAELHAVPAALSVGPARELVGQPFLRDYLLANVLGEKHGGPIHIIACQKTATETQAVKLLGFPDATLVPAPFGIFAADPIQKVQFVFLTNCRDEGNTRRGLQLFLNWMEQTGENSLVARRALSRARIIRAVSKEVIIEPGGGLPPVPAKPGSLRKPVKKLLMQSAGLG